MSTFKISGGLDQADYPEVAKKVASLMATTGITSAQIARWCDAKSECACRGCANRHLTWAEYECYRKYNPEFNRSSMGLTDT